MPILTKQSAEPDNSIEARQERMAVRIASESAQNFETLCQIQKTGIRLVWENDQGLTPQEVCDSLGAEMSKVFAMHAKLTEAIVYIATVDGSKPDILLPTKAFEVNKDGSITVLDKPYGT